MSLLFRFSQSNRNGWDGITSKLNTKIFDTKLGFKKDFEVEIREIKKKPTTSQRAYYYGVILPAINNYLRQEGNYYKSLEELDRDIKEAIKDEFGLYTEVANQITNKIERRTLSLSNAKGDRENIKKYIEAVLCWAAKDCGLNIPSPY